MSIEIDAEGEGYRTFYVGNESSVIIFKDDGSIELVMPDIFDEDGEDDEASVASVRAMLVAVLFSGRDESERIGGDLMELANSIGVDEIGLGSPTFGNGAGNIH